MGTLFSTGKLLLTSEYVVLDGALSLAVPTKVGQDLIFEEVNDGNSTIIWEGFHENKPWLKIKFNYKNWQILETDLPESANFILKVLQLVQQFSSTKFQESTSYHFKTNLQFPANFGLGSSSTLMNNLANWANIDAFVLNDSILGGSGYDVAVAQERSAILFKKEKNESRFIERIEFKPNFCEDLIFIHLNKKQNSREGIALYKSKTRSEILLDRFSEITKKVIFAKTLEEFSLLMILHERLLSEFLDILTAKEKYFQDCPVFIKSLGAWGGDFILSAKFVGYEKYFKSKGFPTIIEWIDLID